MDELTGGRGVVFATGTPVSNSMTALYTIQSYLQKALPACRYCIMAREILLSKKTEQGLRLAPRTKLLLIFIISIFVMGGTGGEAMGLIRLVLCTVPAILLLTSKQCAKAVGSQMIFYFCSN